MYYFDRKDKSNVMEVMIIACFYLSIYEKMK